MLQRTSSLFGLNNSNWHADGLDWIGQSIQAIGYHCGFDVKSITLTIENYRVEIPNVLESLDYIEYNGHRLPLGIEKSDYQFVRPNGRYEDLRTANYNDALLLDKELERLTTLQEMKPVTQEIIDAIIDTNWRINTLVKDLRLGVYAATYRHHYYNIEGRYIKTSFPSGNIKLTGEFYKVDEFGYPLIVDTFNYKEAVTWFIIYRLILQGYKHPTVDLRLAKNEWEDFQVKARNEKNMPDIDELERFTQRWTSVKRDATNAHRIDEYFWYPYNTI